MTEERFQAANRGLAIVAVQCSAVRQLAEVNQTLVLRINTCLNRQAGLW